MDGAFDVGLANDARDADGGGRDHLDVHRRGGQRLEHLRRHTGIRLHAGPDEAHLADRAVGRDADGADLARKFAGDRRGLVDVCTRDCEADVGHAVIGDVLHDHVDVHVGVGEDPEDPSSDARLVRHPSERDLCL